MRQIGVRGRIGFGAPSEIHCHPRPVPFRPRVRNETYMTINETCSSQDSSSRAQQATTLQRRTLARGAMAALITSSRRVAAVPGGVRRVWKNRNNVAVAVLSAVTLVGTALAFSNVSLTLGSGASYDFGNQGGVQPATIQFHTFTMKPGDTVPWHYHKAMSYAVLERGTLTETHADESGSCVSAQFSAGIGFVEQPGEVHTVTNSGHGAALVTWATAFPTSDGTLQISPQFIAGGIYFASPPCN